LAAVSNSSPLILLAKCGRLDLLRGVYGLLVVPPAVKDEVVAPPPRAGAEIQVLSWLRVQAPGDSDLLRSLKDDLDLGEAEAVALAFELQEAVILDDRPARRRARSLGLAVTGTAGVLVVAKQRGIVSVVHPLLDELRAAGLRLGDEAYQAVLEAAGE
jgi:predicted nucleic acid-binding protein